MEKIKNVLFEMFILSVITGITPAILCGLLYRIFGL